MKKQSTLTGLIGITIFTLGMGLMIGKMYIMGSILLLAGIVIIDWNRNGQ
jgi:hypothetical protein